MPGSLTFGTKISVWTGTTLNVCWPLLLTSMHRRRKSYVAVPALWLTLELKMQMNERDYYLKKARQSNKESDWLLFKQTRNDVIYSVRQAKSTHCRHLLQEFFDPHSTFSHPYFKSSLNVILNNRFSWKSLENNFYKGLDRERCIWKYQAEISGVLLKYRSIIKGIIKKKKA